MAKNLRIAVVGVVVVTAAIETTISIDNATVREDLDLVERWHFDRRVAWVESKKIPWWEDCAFRDSHAECRVRFHQQIPGK